MSDWQIDNITLPGDVEWIDRTRWSPTKESQELSLSGGVIIQRSTQQAGRPITLQTSKRGVLVTLSDVQALEALRDNPSFGPFIVTEPDGSQHQCRFRYSDGEPIDAAPLFYKSPPQGSDPYNLTLRLMIV